LEVNFTKAIVVLERGNDITVVRIHPTHWVALSQYGASSGDGKGRPSVALNARGLPGSRRVADEDDISPTSRMAKSRVGTKRVLPLQQR